ncbi:MAG: NMD3-related protein [Candidatus Jordarchaeales archaeon]|nr:hypothetical protein [Candidatus Jordarchaeia archaeon]
MVKFCAFCGKTEIMLIENVCLPCYFKREMSRSAFNVRASFCPSCLSYRVKGKWFEPSSTLLSEIIEEITEKGIEISLPPEFKGTVSFKFQHEQFHLKEGKTRLVLAVYYKEPKLTLKENVTVFFDFKFVNCPSCVKMRKEPKEAVLQFRSFDGKINAQLRKKILSIIEKEARLKGVSHKVEDGKTWFDVKLSSQSFARSIAQRIKEIFNAELKETFKLKGVNDGKKGILSISIRLPPESAAPIKAGGETKP